MKSLLFIAFMFLSTIISRGEQVNRQLITDDDQYVPGFFSCAMSILSSISLFSGLAWAWLNLGWMPTLVIAMGIPLFLGLIVISGEAWKPAFLQLSFKLKNLLGIGVVFMSLYFWFFLNPSVEQEMKTPNLVEPTPEVTTQIPEYPEPNMPEVVQEQEIPENFSEPRTSEEIAVKTATYYTTSFNCNASRLTLSARYICKNSALANLDIKMARIYAKMIRPLDLSDKKLVIAEQKKWIQKRNQCASQKSPVNCMLKAYSNRIKELNANPTKGSLEPQMMPNSVSAAAEAPSIPAPQPDEIHLEPQENLSEPIYLNPKEGMIGPEPEKKP